MVSVLQSFSCSPLCLVCVSLCAWLSLSFSLLLFHSASWMEALIYATSMQPTTLVSVAAIVYAARSSLCPKLFGKDIIPRCSRCIFLVQPRAEGSLTDFDFIAERMHQALLAVFVDALHSDLT